MARVKVIIGWGNSNWRGEALVNAPADSVVQWFGGDATEIPNTYRNRIMARFWQMKMPTDFAAASGGSATFGTASATTATTLTATGSTWVVNALAGKFLVVTEGSGQEIEEIASNTADTITVAAWTGDTPVPGVRFAVYDTDPRKSLAAGMALGGRWHDLSGEVIDQPHYVTGYEYPSHHALPRISPWQHVQTREFGQIHEIARILSEHWGERVYVVHLGVGGTVIRATTGTGSIQPFAWFDPTMVSWHPDEDGQLYDALMLHMVPDAMAALEALGLQPDVALILCTPGENEASDATNAANAGDNLADIVAAMRADIFAGGWTTHAEDEIPVVASGVPDVAIWDYVTETNESMQTVADADPSMRLVPTLDLTLSDGVHYDADGAMGLGPRMAAAFLGIPKHVVPTFKDKCLRPDEWILMNEIPGAGSDPIIGYTPIERPSLVNPATGEIERPPTSYILEPASAGTPYVEVEVTATSPDIVIDEETSITGIEHTLFHAKRSGEVTRWETTYTYDGDTVTVSWLRRVDLGQSFNLHSRQYENHLQSNIIEHNPDSKGADMDPDQDALESSPVRHYRNASGAPGAAFAEACTDPLQFDPSGDAEGPDVDHGGSETVQALFWRQRQFKRYDPCFPAGHQFRGLVHRVVNWIYDPNAWVAADFNGHLVCLEGAGPAIIDIFDEAFIRDLETGTTTAIEDWDDGGNTEHATWSFTTRHRQATGDVTIAETEPSLIPSGYGACIYRDPVTDFTIGIAFKLAEMPSGPLGNIHIGNGCVAPNWAAMFQSRNPGTFPRPTDHDDNSGQAFLLFTRGTSRNRGWLGHQFYVYTGPYDFVEDALDAVYAAGLLDADVPQDVVPTAATVGTLWPPGSEPVATIRRAAAPESDSTESEGLLQ